MDEELNIYPDTNNFSVNSLQYHIRRLNELVKAFSLLNSTLDLDTVLLQTLNSATRLMNAEMGSIALINEEKTHLIFVESTDPNFDKLRTLKVPIGKGIAGYVAQTGQSVRVDDVSQDSRFYTEIDRKLQHTTHSYLCLPLIVNGELIGTAQIMNRINGEPFSEDDERLMNGFARQAALAIQNARLYKMMMKQQALESELRVCSEIQSRLYPSPIPTMEQYEFFGESTPCREVGGDYFTFIPRADGTMDVAIADVSGKGLTASMLVSEVHTGFHLLSRMEATLGETIQALNNHLSETLLLGKFITFFGARLYPDSGEFDYVVAGHPPPYILGEDGSARELVRTGAVLGLPGNTIEQRRDRFRPGDLMVAFSDGYSEVQTKPGDLFGEERIAEKVGEWRGLDLPQIAANLDAEIDRYRGEYPIMDDATLVLLKRK